MKLVRFGAPGREKPGIIDDKGRIRDLSKVVPDIAGETLSPKGLAKIRKTDISKLPLVKAGTRLGPCVGDIAPLHRDRAQLRRPRRRDRRADPEGADHLQEGADLHRRAERRHHDPEGLDQARLGGRARRS